MMSRNVKAFQILESLFFIICVQKRVLPLKRKLHKKYCCNPIHYTQNEVSSYLYRRSSNEKSIIIPFILLATVNLLPIIFC